MHRLSSSTKEALIAVGFFVALITLTALFPHFGDYFPWR